MKAGGKALSARTSRPIEPLDVAQTAAEQEPQGVLDVVSPRLTRFYTALVRRHALVLLVAVAWTANFLRFGQFGYYEDDWYSFPPMFGQTLLQPFYTFLPLIKSFFLGRPMAVLFGAFFVMAGEVSITLPYLSVFALFTATALLFYRVLRMRFPPLFCLTATLVFVLSPLTSVRQNLGIGSLLAEAFICVLTAILLRRRHPVFACILAIAAFFTYESVSLLFLAAPLFEPGRLRRKKLRTTAVHVAVFALILLGSVVLRWVLGEGRIVAAAAIRPGALIASVVSLDLYYSVRSFMAYPYAASVGWRATSLESLVYLGGFSIWSLIVLLSSRFNRPRHTRRALWLQKARRMWWLWNGCAFSLALIAIGYLTIYFQTSGNPILYSGRDTRFSAAAVPGSSMFLASLVMLFELAPWKPFIWIARTMLAVCLSFLFLYSFVIQDDYVRAWDYERNFLSQVVLLTHDLEPNGLIVVRTGLDPQPGLGPKDHIGSIGWQRFGLVVSLKCLGGWSSPPEIIFVGSDTWKDHLRFGPDGRLHWTQLEASGSTAQFVVPGRVIVLDERSDGLLTRSDQPVIVEGKAVQEKSGTNIALGKAAHQSSTFGQSYAMYGVDGHLASEHSAWGAISRSQLLQRIVSPVAATALSGLDSLPSKTEKYAGFQTGYEPAPWWEVDLGRSFVLQQVRIYNGLPGFFQRAASLRILLSDDDNNWSVVYDNRGKVFGPEPLTVNLADIGARYLRIQLAEPNPLHLEQVEVFGY